jgi:hypothetical protein
MKSRSLIVRRLTAFSKRFDCGEHAVATSTRATLAA